MKLTFSPLLFSTCLLILIRINWAGLAPGGLVKHGDAKAASRQQISYNLDLVNRNGSSSLLYSQPNDVINGGFTEWSSWSECGSDCGKRSLRSRERYCTNPPPSHDGADCDGERFQLTLCKVVPCSPTVTSSPAVTSSSAVTSSPAVFSRPKQRHVIGKFGQWSGWSRCQCRKPYQKRYRQCYSHSGSSCLGRRVERRACEPRGCKTSVTEKSSLVDIDPKQFCGFNPCDISKCLLDPLGSCVSDYKCRPVFFDENNKRVEGCVGNRIYISPAQVPQVCKINPCKFTRCLMDFTEERCVVGTKCQAIYYSATGQPQKCTAVLKVPAREVCGYDPCNGESCEDNPNARCLVTSKCRPVFVNTFNERIRKCEEEAASKTDRIQEGSEEEFEAEPDDGGDGGDDDDQDKYNQDSIDDIASDNDDGDYDSNRYSFPKRFQGEEGDTERSEGAGVGREGDEYEEDGDEEDGDEDVEKNYKYFKHNLAHAEGRLQDYPGHRETLQNEPNANMVENSKNFTNPLFKFLNAENGDRRSKKPNDETSSFSINPASFNLQDLVSGKLNNSTGLVVGTVKKSMKILSNKKPTTYYYFETKGKNSKENRQFMVITSKSKKSSVHPKRDKKREK